MRTPASFRLRLAPLALAVAALGAACLQGARAPEVAPRGTLAPGDGTDTLGKSEGPFAVVFASPKGPTVDPSEVTVVWNRPMHPLEVAGQETRPPVVLKPDVPGHWIWVGTTGATFTPASHLPRATEFTLEVPAGTRALDGAILDKPFVRTFSTARPHLLDATPTAGSSDAMEPGTQFDLHFNQPVGEAEATQALHLVMTGKDGPVPVNFTVSRPDPEDEQLLRVAPRAALPLDSAFSLDAEPSLRGKEGPLPAGSRAAFAFRTYGPLLVKSLDCNRDGPRGQCSPTGGFSIELSGQVKVADLKKALRVEPAVKIQWPSWLNGDDNTQSFSVWARFVPGRTYRVSLDGVRDAHGQPLAAPFTKQVAFDDLWPNAVIGLRGTFIEPGAHRAIPVASVNVKELELATAPLDEPTILALFGDKKRAGHALRVEHLRSLPGAKVTVLHPAAAINTAAEQKVSTDEVLGGKDRRGPLGIALSYTERPGTSRARVGSESVIAQVTDLAISAKISRHGSVVWVTHLSTGAPVEGATVHVASLSRGASASFTTDRSGFADVPAEVLDQPDDELDRAVIFARSGDDWAYRPLADKLLSWRFGASVDTSPDRPFGMMFTDRGIYRPGDVVHVKGIFREEAARGTTTPAGRFVTVELAGPDGEKISTERVQLSTFGTLATDLKVPDTGRLGTYAMVASVEGSPRGYADINETFEVAEYRPAEFKVAIESDHPSYVRGDAASWTARGDYLFGAPMSGSDAALRVTRHRSGFAPPGTEGFSTGDEPYEDGRPEASESHYEVQSSTAKLDARGTATLTAALALPGQQGAEIVTAEADVTDLSRQTLSASTSALVHPGEFYVGVKPGADLFVKATEALKPEIIAVDPKGARVAGVPVAVELVQRRWVVAKEQVGGGHRTASTLVDSVVSSCTVTTARDPVYCAVQPSGVGYYLLRATAKDRRGNPLAASAGLYATGDTGTTSWSDGDSQSVELVPDRKSYHAGQTAHVLVKSPFKSADAWITVERSGIFSSRRAVLSGPMPTVDVPITDDLRPNAFVSVLLVRGRSKPAPARVGASDVGAPAFRMGYAALPIDPEVRRLSVKLQPSRSEARPGEGIDVDVDVKDRTGAPAHAEVTLYAVDEGVLSLIGYKTPDPVPYFGAPRSLKVSTLESREAMASVINAFAALGLDKGLEGGDGGGATTARHDFRASAYWSPALVTDAAGHIHASFKLPDSLTTYRVMAVATAVDDRFGYAESHVVTSRPLMARPAFPRFLRAGDAIEAGVVVTSKGLGKIRVEVEIAADGLTVKGDTRRTVDLDAGGSAEVRFPIEAPRAGHAKISFHASQVGGQADDRVEITREIAVPLSLEAAALYGDTTHEAAEKLGDLSAVRDDTGGLVVSYSSSALVGLGGGVEQLIEYPYGCTEQLTSRLVPLLPLRDLATDYNVPLPKDIDRLVAKTVSDVLSHQRSDGGFGFWAESAESSPWLTAYALWGLGVAAEHHAAVPGSALESATRYLREALPNMDRDEIGLASMPFVIDVLAEQGTPDPGRASVLFEKRDKLPLFAQALLLHAMVLGKSDAVSIEKLSAEIEGHVRLDASVAHAVADTGSRYAVLMDSDTRTSALVLRGLLAARPAHPLAARLAMGLLADRRGGTWRNTQETAWSLLALDAYRRAQEQTAPDFTAHVFIGQAEIASSGFHGRSLAQPRVSVPAARLVAAAGAPLGFTVDGQGRLFYEARLRYARKELPREGLERGFFVKKTLRAVKPEGLDAALHSLGDPGALAFRGSDLILGDILVVTPSPREIVVLDDPLPAGFEAVDARLATTGAGSSIDEAEARAAAAGAEEDGPGPSQFVREIRDDRVLFFIDHLPAGMFHYRYLARATTLGTFVVPPTRVEEMYTPEVFGRTGATVVKVSEK